MARKFENVSPHGELIYEGRRYAVGDVIEVSDEVGDRFAESTFNWKELPREVAKKSAEKPSEKADKAE